MAVARARALVVLLAASGSYGQLVPSARTTTRCYASHALKPAASSGARMLRGVPPPSRSWAPVVDSDVQACIGFQPLTGRQRIAVLAAYASAAICTYLESSDEEARADEIVLKPKRDDLITLLKTLVVEVLLDPTVTILFPYVSLNAFLEQFFGHHFSQFECPFTGMIELPPFDSVSENDSKGSNATNGDGLIIWPLTEWGKNMWPDITEKFSLCETCCNKMSINEAATVWGLKCLIMDIYPEGDILDQSNCAKGETEAIIARSQATAEGIRKVSESMSAEGSTEAAILRVAVKYKKAFATLAKNTATIVLSPSMIAQSLNICKHIFKSYSPIGGNH